MCGISGILSRQRQAATTIEDSLKSIKHRGPDDTLLFDASEKRMYALQLSSSYTKGHFNLFDNAASNCWLGFNRLSIVDLSHHAMQPFYDKDSGCVFMMNGEIYNYRQIKNNFLEDEKFFSGSDSEAAFKLYLKLGNDFIHQLRGMFAIIIYDTQRQILKVWRDRFGQKPFYYSFQNGNFIFSSEMKGIFATGLIEKELEYSGLAYSMFLGTCPAPKTIFKNIHSLQAGHYLEFSFGEQEIITKPYWTLQYKPYTTGIPADELLGDINDLTMLHATGDVAKAIMLSGGLDSGLLSYFTAKNDPSVKALNIFSENHYTDERILAAANARCAGIDLTTIQIPDKISDDELNKYLASEEEPNHTPEPAYFLCETAKEMDYKVLYNALGPDELFGGYDYYRKVNAWEHKIKAAAIIPDSLFPKAYRSKVPLVKKYGLGIFGLLAKQNFLWEEIIAFLDKNNQPVPPHPVDYLVQQARALYPGFDKMPLLKKISWFDFHYYIASHHTFRSDQPSMQHSIEMRFPFLDHLFIEKYFNDARTFDGIAKKNKPRFREAAQKILPQAVMHAPKMGFRMPVEQWVDIQSGNPSKAWYTMCLKKISPDSI